MYSLTEQTSKLNKRCGCCGGALTFIRTKLVLAEIEYNSYQCFNNNCEVFEIVITEPKPVFNLSLQPN